MLLMLIQMCPMKVQRFLLLIIVRLRVCWNSWKQLMKRDFDDPSNLEIHYSSLWTYDHYWYHFHLWIVVVSMDWMSIQNLRIQIPTEGIWLLNLHILQQLNHNQPIFRDLFLMGNQIPMSFLMKLVEEFPMKPNIEKDKLNKVLLGWDSDIPFRLLTKPFSVRCFS